MSFNPAGTQWSVYLFSNDSMTGEPDEQPWNFNDDSSMSSGDRWHGTYHRIPDTDSGFRCELFSDRIHGEPPFDRFDVYFVSSKLFVATKDGSLYRIGKRLEASVAIDVMILVDTASLLQSGNGQGSTPDNPAGCDHSWAFMITDLSHVERGNGTADLHLKGAVGQTIRLNFSSLSNQLDAEVIVYEFRHWKGDNDLDPNGIRFQVVNRSEMVPERGSSDNKPPLVVRKDSSFYFGQVDLVNPGTEYFYVTFMVYGSPTDTQGNRPVKGYFRWDPTITAHS